jgi:hypothetical protein
VPVTSPGDPGRTSLDPSAVGAFQLMVWGFKQGEVVSLMIHLGDRLGLYRQLAGAGPVTAGQLAERTGLHERWLREWLRGQAAAHLLRSGDGDTFELTAEGVAVLADEEGSLAFAAGAFGGPPLPAVVDGLVEAFTTGMGMPYDQLGEAGAHTTARQLGPWSRLALVPVVLPALDGVVAKLEAGARVADVGCGAGVAVLVLAEAVPGVDLRRLRPVAPRHRPRRGGGGRRRRPQRGVPPRPGRGPPPGAGYDLVMALDCLHDMTDPAAALRAIRAPSPTTAPCSSRRCAAPAAGAGPAEPDARACSTASPSRRACRRPCRAGRRRPRHARPAARVLRTMCADAGFTRVRLHDVDDPANLYYEVRP